VKGCTFRPRPPPSSRRTRTGWPPANRANTFGLMLASGRTKRVVVRVLPFPDPGPDRDAVMCMLLALSSSVLALFFSCIVFMHGNALHQRVLNLCEENEGDRFSPHLLLR